MRFLIHSIFNSLIVRPFLCCSLILPRFICKHCLKSATLILLPIETLNASFSVFLSLKSNRPIPLAVAVRSSNFAILVAQVLKLLPGHILRNVVYKNSPIALTVLTHIYLPPFNFSFTQSFQCFFSLFLCSISDQSTTHASVSYSGQNLCVHYLSCLRHVLNQSRPVYTPSQITNENAV